jgi:hypothetical protein
MSTQAREVPPAVFVAAALLWLAWLLGVGLLFSGPASPDGLPAYLVAHIEGSLTLLLLAGVTLAFGMGHNWARIALLVFVGLVLLSWLASAITGYNILFGYGRLVRSALALATVSLAISFTSVASHWFRPRTGTENAA